MRCRCARYGITQRLKPAQPRLIVGDALHQLFTAHLECREKRLRAQCRSSQWANFVECEAEILQQEDSLQGLELCRRVVAITRALINMRRPDQASFIVVMQVF